MTLIFSIAPAASQPSSPLQDNILPMLAVIAIVGIGVWITISIRGKIARRNAERPTPRELIDKLKAGHEPRGSLDTVVARSVDTVQRLAAQLDNKAQRLEILIEQADERLSRLEAVKQGQEVAAEDTASPPSTPHRAASAARELDPLTVAVYDLSDSGQSTIEIAQHLDEQVGKVELILTLRDR